MTFLPLLVPLYLYHIISYSTAPHYHLLLQPINHILNILILLIVQSLHPIMNRFQFLNKSILLYNILKEVNLIKLIIPNISKVPPCIAISTTIPISKAGVIQFTIKSLKQGRRIEGRGANRTLSPPPRRGTSPEIIECEHAVAYPVLYHLLCLLPAISLIPCPDILL